MRSIRPTLTHEEGELLRDCLSYMIIAIDEDLHGCSNVHTLRIFSMRITRRRIAALKDKIFPREQDKKA